MEEQADKGLQLVQDQSPPLPQAGPVNRFYLLRYRYYSAVMVFIVGTGLLVTGVPSVRHRFTARLNQLRDAARGYTGPPTVEAQVGQNPEPFPAQYEKPIVIPQKPSVPLITFNQGVPQIVPQQSQSAAKPRELSQPKARRTLRIPTTVSGREEAEPTAQTTQPAQQPAETDANLEPDFRQGEVEREAYNLVLQKYMTVSGMVTGNNPALQFRNWGAAKREEDTYWVRLVFLQASDKTEVSYIWEVKVGAKQVTPLNYNARSLPKA